VGLYFDCGPLQWGQVWNFLLMVLKKNLNIKAVLDFRVLDLTCSTCALRHDFRGHGGSLGAPDRNSVWVLGGKKARVFRHPAVQMHETIPHEESFHVSPGYLLHKNIKMLFTTLTTVMSFLGINLYHKKGETMGVFFVHWICSQGLFITLFVLRQGFAM
jgi:hypothetical protein